MRGAHAVAVAADGDARGEEDEAAHGERHCIELGPARQRGRRHGGEHQQPDGEPSTPAQLERDEHDRDHGEEREAQQRVVRGHPGGHDGGEEAGSGRQHDPPAFGPAPDEKPERKG